MLHQYDAVAAALATHVADVADEEQLELAADALVKHLLFDVMDDVKAGKKCGKIDEIEWNGV